MPLTGEELVKWEKSRDLSAELFQGIEDIASGNFRIIEANFEDLVFKVDLARIPTKTISSHPGDILLNEFLSPMGISKAALAEKLNVPVKLINDIVKSRRGITADLALLLSDFFRTSMGLWMNMQTSYDISKRCVEDPTFLAKIKKIKRRTKRNSLTKK